MIHIFACKERTAIVLMKILIPPYHIIPLADQHPKFAHP
jgi:hypothetical protein